MQYNIIQYNLQSVESSSHTEQYRDAAGVVDAAKALRSFAFWRLTTRNVPPADHYMLLSG